VKKLLDHIKSPSPIQLIQSELLRKRKIKLYIKREDLLHPIVSGNKWRKLKYNLKHAIDSQKSPIITFGGSFSNHLYATAGACHALGIPSIGIVRGEIDSENPTLKFCLSHNMNLIPCSRSDYREGQQSQSFKNLLSAYPTAHVVPEGGTNELALVGIAELWEEIKTQFRNAPEFTCLPVGTGGTAAGLLSNMPEDCLLVGYSALKTDHLYNEVCNLLGITSRINLYIKTQYHFGGYGKTDFSLLSFIRNFEKEHNIPLDPIYTGKAMYGLMADIEQGKFPPGSTLLFIHTGGLQGINGVKYLAYK